MTLLTVCQSAAILLNQPAPGTIMSSTDLFAQELRVLANKSAKEIQKGADWRDLTFTATITGDGTATSFPLPADYDRMAVDTGVVLVSSYIPLEGITDLSTWRDLTLGLDAVIPGAWMIIGGTMNIYPALADQEQVVYYYLTKNVVGTPPDQPTFQADTDVFSLSEDLLELAIIWKWRSLKKLDFTTELDDYNLRFDELSSSQKGARSYSPMAPNRRGLRRRAWPFALGGS